MKIGILDDDITTLQILEQTLKGGDNILNRPDCRFFTKGFDMLAAVKNEVFDCLILDRQLPDMSGDVILQWVRQYSVNKFGVYTSVILLTNMASEMDEVQGLQGGADDYIVKPLKPSVLIQRIHHLHMISQHRIASKAQQPHSTEQPNPPARQTEFKRFGYIFNDIGRIVTLSSGEMVQLTAREFELSRYFFEHACVQLSRKQILQQIWHTNDATQSTHRTLDTHVHRIRVKLQLVSDKGFDLRTIYGFGYSLYVSVE